MKDFAISWKTLHQLFLTVLQNASVWFDIADTLPSLFVDFDGRELWSLQPEGVSLESYVPAGWQGKYADFFRYLPSHERYWEENGMDLTSRFRIPESRG